MSEYYFKTKKEAKIYLQKSFKQHLSLALKALKNLEKGCDLEVNAKIHLTDERE